MQEEIAHEYTKTKNIITNIFLGSYLLYALCLPNKQHLITNYLAEKSPQQILEEQLIDDTHDAFLVNTGGELGILLVTAELDEKTPTEVFYATVQFTVWNPNYMDEPLQILIADTNIFLDWSVIDANFDGYMDFSCTYLRGIQPYYDHLWIWNEKHKKFESVPEYDEISTPSLDEETKTIYGFNRSSIAGDGITTFHRWEDGKLVCVRQIESYVSWKTTTIFVKDRIDGELQQIYYKEFPWSDEEPEKQGWRQAAHIWSDLNYHGESTEEN